MEMKHIDIDITDNRRFADVVLLVDNKRFLQDIQELKSCLGFPIIDREYRDWLKQSKRNELPDEIFQKLATWIAQKPECTFIDYAN